MLEKIFSQPDPERAIEREIERVLKLDPLLSSKSIRDAFVAAQKLNTDKNFGLSDEVIVNLLSAAALGNASVLDDHALGGVEVTTSLIMREIRELRKSLTTEIPDQKD